MSEKYNNRTFFNWQSYETLSPLQKTSKDNPDFLWPKRSLRNPVNGVSEKIQRGYMRMLSEALGTRGTNQALRDMGSHRLFFQFNPDTITRSVTARNDIQYWMNMDPIQLTQPIPGDQNFAFELLFNREAEMASGQFPNQDMFKTKRVRIDRNDRPIIEESGLHYSQNPAMVGVLADLYKFDQIIGQGLNKAVIDAYVANAEALENKRRSNLNKKSGSSTEEGEGATKDDEDKEQPLPPLSQDDKDLISKNLYLNVGNSAFLVANPIRIIFSSLFMVEGYVTQASVVFNKFNASMVPTQCVVTINMQALYIGFAKKETFLTSNASRIDEALGDLEEEEAAQKNEERRQVEFIKGYADTGFKSADKVPVSTVRGAFDLIGESGSRTLKVKLNPSDELKNAIKDGQVSKVTATAEWRTRYVNNTNGKPSQSPSYGTSWSSTTSVDYDLNDLSKVYTFRFSRPTLQQGFIIDKANTSIYASDVRITFTYTSGGGYSAKSKQVVTWSAISRYDLGFNSQDPKVFFGNNYTLSKG